MAIDAPGSWNDRLQQWLFHGFHEWGPSWDLSWNLDDPAHDDTNPCFIAQLGVGDESDSISVVIAPGRAKGLRGELLDGWGGLEAELSGVLVHRTQLGQSGEPVRLFGNILDFWLRIDDGNDQHGIEPLTQGTDIYSGYLWKCVTTRTLLRRGRLGLRDVYFIWEHTNFADDDSVKYNLDSLAHKESYIRARQGEELVLLQKCCVRVPGAPEWSGQQLYNLLLGKTGRRI